MFGSEERPAHSLELLCLVQAASRSLLVAAVSYFFGDELLVLLEAGLEVDDTRSAKAFGDSDSSILCRPSRSSRTELLSRLRGLLVVDALVGIGVVGRVVDCELVESSSAPVDSPCDGLRGPSEIA